VPAHQKKAGSYTSRLKRWNWQRRKIMGIGQNELLICGGILIVFGIPSILYLLRKRRQSDPD
jgi:hypothetical protein